MDTIQKTKSLVLFGILHIQGKDLQRTDQPAIPAVRIRLGELTLLLELAKHPNVLRTLQAIVEALGKYPRSFNSIRVTYCTLRKKLKDLGLGAWLVSKRGQGYGICPTELAKPKLGLSHVNAAVPYTGNNSSKHWRKKTRKYFPSSSKFRKRWRRRRNM